MKASPILELLEPRLAPAGIVTVTLTTAGALTITGSAVDNSIHVEDIGGGTWKISDHNADGTTFSLNGAAAAAELLIRPGLSIKATLNGGNDSLLLDALHIAGAVTIAGNDGDDTINLAAVHVGGAVSVDAGNGADQVEAAGFFNNTLTIKTAAGNDTFTLGDGCYAKGATVDLGADSNTFLGNFTGTFFFGTLSVTAAGGAAATQNFTLIASDSSIAGSVLFKTTTGATNLTLGKVGGHLRISGNLTVQTGAGNDSLSLIEDIHIGGLFTIAAGNGNNALNGPGLGDLSCAAFSYAGGTGGDTFAIAGGEIVIGGNATLNAGNGVNSFDFASTTSLRIAGALAYTGGTAGDILNISGPSATIYGAFTVKGANGDNYIRFTPTAGILGSVAYTGGAGANDLQLGQFLGGSTLITIHGGVTTNMGVGGGANLLLRDCLVYGAITHVSDIPVGHGDSAAIRESTVLGAVSLTMKGASSADIDVDDSTLYSALTVSTGASTDSIELDTVDGFGGLRSRFYGAIKILFGDGDDTLFVARNPLTVGCGCDFYSTVTIDGGAGSDTAHLYLTSGSNNFFGSAATTPNVETKD